MDISETNEPKVSIAAKIPASWNDDIDAICLVSGQTKSQWLAQVIGDALGKTNSEARENAIRRLSLLLAQAVSPPTAS
jgi:hypothetical protein